MSHFHKDLRIWKDFLNAVPAYIDALAVSCDKLAVIARFKQNILEKTQRRDVFGFDKLLKDYQNAQSDLVRAGAFVQVAWGSLMATKQNAEKTQTP